MSKILVSSHYGLGIWILFDVFFRRFSNKFFRPDQTLGLGGSELNRSPVALPVRVAQKKDLKIRSKITFWYKRHWQSFVL